jgi:DNA-directed RNA polymerase alpha subunit
MHTKYSKDTTKWLVENYNWTEIDMCLELSVRSTRILRENNITTLKQLRNMSDKELLGLKGLGKISLAEIKMQLSCIK